MIKLHVGGCQVAGTALLQKQKERDREGVHGLLFWTTVDPAIAGI